MRTVVIILVVVVVIFVCGILSGCSKEPRSQAYHQNATRQARGHETLQRKEPSSETYHQNATVKGETLTPAVNNLGFKLYAKLNGTGSRKNIFISPSSIEFCLAMTYNGARSTTKDAMAAVLDYKGMSVQTVNASNEKLMASLMKPAKDMELAIANSIWNSKTTKFSSDFISTVKDHYQAEVASVDMHLPRTATRINDWVSDKTRGNIPTIVSSSDISDSLMVLVNAIYFKGKWLVEFPKSATKNDQFRLLDGKSKTVAMMNLTDTFQYMENKDFQAVSLPYKGAESGASMSMYVFLPRSNKSWQEFTSGFTAQNWDKWMDQIKTFGKRKGSVSLPKFKLQDEQLLNAPLSQIGMEIAFAAERADFTGMLPPGSPIPSPFISKVIHKTTLDVDEVGTVATAVTAVVMAPGGGYGMNPESPFVMKVDHPFFLAIADNNTGTLLFLGTVVDP